MTKHLFCDIKMKYKTKIKQTINMSRFVLYFNSTKYPHIQPQIVRVHYMNKKSTYLSSLSFNNEIDNLFFYLNVTRFYKYSNE